jgi:hypothetical protein
MLNSHAEVETLFIQEPWLAASSRADPDINIRFFVH